MSEKNPYRDAPEPSYPDPHFFFTESDGTERYVNLAEITYVIVGDAVVLRSNSEARYPCAAVTKTIYAALKEYRSKCK